MQSKPNFELCAMSVGDGVMNNARLFHINPFFSEPTEGDIINLVAIGGTQLIESF